MIISLSTPTSQGNWGTHELHYPPSWAATEFDCTVCLCIHGGFHSQNTHGFQNPQIIKSTVLGTSDSSNTDLARCKYSSCDSSCGHVMSKRHYEGWRGHVWSPWTSESLQKIWFIVVQHFETRKVPSKGAILANFPASGDKGNADVM